MGIKVGIDLGTTFSAVAVYNERSGRPEIIKNICGENTTPSVIQFTDDGEIIVGTEAKEAFESGEDGCVSVFKRKMGDASPYCTFYGNSYTAEDLSAILLGYLKESAEQVTGQTIDEAVVTVPAYFYQQERAATMKAAKRAGLNVRQIINEPVAAALTYAVSHWRENARIMVYDLGGGTFDVTMVQMQEYGVMRSLETTGNHILGGKDWDEELVKLICDKIFSETNTDISDLPDVYRTVARQAENIKKKLTTYASTSLNIRLPDYGYYTVTITVEEFNSCTRPLLERTGNLCQNLLNGLNMKWDEVTDILLVGGSTKMKQVPAYLKEISGHIPLCHVNPDEAVATGAAIQVHLPMPEYLVTTVSSFANEFGSRFKFNTKPPAPLQIGQECILDNALSVRPSDIVAHAMGIIAVNDDGTQYINKTIIPANQQIPCKCAEAFHFYTTEKGKNEMEIFVLQGTAAPLECNIIGKYVVSGIRHNKYDNPTTVRIQYSYDVNGMIHVQARQGDSTDDLPIIEKPVDEDMSKYGKPVVPEETGENIYEPVSLIMALDVSGSMNGSPIRNAKKAMCKFVDQLSIYRGAVKIGIMVVSDETMECQALTDDFDACKKAIKDIRAEMTGINNFWHPFYKINDSFENVNGKKYAVVLADGVWMNPQRAIEAARLCHDNGIDVIGMGFGDADEKFLKAITSGSIDSIMLGESRELEKGFGTIAQEISNINSLQIQKGKTKQETSTNTWEAAGELKISKF